MDFNKIYKIGVLSKYIIWTVDSILPVFSFCFCYLFFHYLVRVEVNTGTFLTGFVTSLVVSMMATTIFKTYKGIIRHTSAVELVRIVYAMLMKTCIIFILSIFTQEYVGRFICSMIFSDFILSVFLLMCIRIMVVNFYDYLLEKVNRSGLKTFIYGTSEAAVSLNNYIRFMSKKDYCVLGFITRDSKLKNYSLQGRPVIYVPEGREKELFEQYQVETILFTNNQDLHMDERLIDYSIKEHLTLRIAPLIEGKEEISRRVQMRDVQIEDFLERDEIQIDMKKLQLELAGRDIMVTGAAGSIGSELCRQLCKYEFNQLILFDFSETATYQIDMELRTKYPKKHIIAVIGDVRNRDSVEYHLKKFRPSLLFHAAAYKHVPMMETYPCEAVVDNIGGTRNVADIAVACGVEKFIMISTDKAVKPSNVMGATKRIAEMYVQSLGQALKNGELKGKTHFITTRFGNVLGSNGSVIPLFREQILSGGPVTVTHPDIIRYFMTIPEACRLVLEASFLGKGNDIFVFDMGNPVKIDTLARKMIQIAGLRPDDDIKIVYTGLRPGEKLYEELLNKKENTVPTQNNKIFRAESIDFSFGKIKDQVDELLKIAQTNEVIETVKCMKDIAKDFVSLHSSYSALDKSK